MIIPFQDVLDELASELQKFEKQEIAEAMKNKSGPAYEILLKRGEIVKRNLENRIEIAKLCTVISKLAQHDREQMGKTIRAGRIEKLDLQYADAKRKVVLARFMRRCGIACAIHEGNIAAADQHKDDEVSIKISNRRVWLSCSSANRLEENLRKMEEVGKKIQVKNALRQVKEFTDEEEAEFASLQQIFLDLMREQDEILRPYHEEEEDPAKPREEAPAPEIRSEEMEFEKD